MPRLKERKRSMQSKVEEINAKRQRKSDGEAGCFSVEEEVETVTTEEVHPTRLFNFVFVSLYIFNVQQVTNEPDREKEDEDDKGPMTKKRKVWKIIMLQQE